MSTVQMRIRGRNRFLTVPSDYEGIREMRRDYELNLRWLLAHYDEFLTQYPEEFIAVYDREVVAHANTIEQLRSQLNKQFGEKMIEDARSIVIRKITAKTEQLIL